MSDAPDPTDAPDIATVLLPASAAEDRSFAASLEDGVYRLTVYNPDPTLHWAVVDRFKAAAVSVRRTTNGVAVVETRDRGQAAEIGEALKAWGYRYLPPPAVSSAATAAE